MKSHSETEENYLKCILRHSPDDELVGTNTIAHDLNTSPASVSDMIRRLSDKQLVIYTKYKGVQLSKEGKKIALQIVRKHRLWEVFLVKKLNFSWDNVHDVAEQLEHIDSAELIKRIDAFLGFPKFDPHGDPIPTEEGIIIKRDTQLLTQVDSGDQVVITSVKRSDQDFLQYLDRLGLTINQSVTVKEKLSFDDSIILEVDQKTVVVNGLVANNLMVIKENA
ncbi:MAG: metal-dependent transcriptional regulator [Bacteroidota bacterium]